MEEEEKKMVFVLFDIGLLIVGFALFLLGLAYVLAPTILYLTVLIPLIVFWSINIRVKRGGAANKIICAAGLIASLFAAGVLKDTRALLASLLTLIGIMAVLQLILLRLAKDGRPAVAYNVVNAAFILFLIVWGIGCEMDARTKVRYDNLAYYQCDKIVLYHTKDTINPEKMKNQGRPLNGTIYDVTDVNILGIGTEHIIGTYGKGDSVQPDLSRSLRRFSNAFDAYDDVTWYPVLTKDNKKGYIPDTGLHLVYHDSSEIERDAFQYFKKQQWYAFLPDSAVSACQSFFKRIPLFTGIHLA